MYLLYSFALSVLFIALLPYFVYQAARHGKYAASFRQRMGRLPDSVRGTASTRTIWVHTVSVGEFLAARPLIHRLRTELPESRIVVSTTTLTGQALAQSHSQSFDGLFYFPFDWKFTVRRALAWIKPSIVIILETELWPNFLRESRKRGVITILANGRISQSSFRRYKRVRWLISETLRNFSLMIMQSQASAERARELGAQGSRVRVCGNLKYDLPGVEKQQIRVKDETESENNNSGGEQLPSGVSEEIDRAFALSSTAHLIVAGSTAPGEEHLLLSALWDIRSHTGLEDTRLVIAPRHPERFNEVASLITSSGFKFVRRSQTIAQSVSAYGATRMDQSSGGVAGRQEAAVILLDTIGELASIYRFAAVVFVGGSLVPRGGHNIIEPAAFAKPILIGPHTENFRQIVADFASKSAVVQLQAEACDANSLTRELMRILSDREQAQAMGDRAFEIIVANRGATDCTITAIKEMMSAAV